MKFEDPGPKPQPKKVKKVEINVKEEDKEIDKETDKIIKEGINHHDEQIPDETVHDEVVHDMEDAGVKVVEPVNNEKDEPKEEKVIQETSSDDIQMHTVTQGETLYAISKKV